MRTVGEVTRLLTMSVADLLERFFESEQVRAVMAVDGLIGTWAGPHEPGTAYVMAHHEIGDVGDGTLGSWGVPEGGMGAVATAIERSARSFGAEIRTDAAVDKILSADGRARGVVLRGGEELLAPTVVTACHPKITFLRQLDRSELPGDFVDDIEHWSTRSGVVKINLRDQPAARRSPANPSGRTSRGGFEIAPSIEYLESAFQEARAGRPATLPFSDGVIPTTLDPSLAPEGAHVVSLFTQWVPHTWSQEPHRAELEAYADRVIQAYDDAAPGFGASVVARQVIGPYDMETEWNLIGGNIFHGELSADQLFHMRPAPGYADYRTPIRGLYQCSSATHGGGGVSGIPAYNCVREIRRDRRDAEEERVKDPYSFTFYTASWYRRSPYWQRTIEAGCTSWDLYNHMLIPTLYDDDEREYWHLVEHVGLWDVAVERQVEITGPDAARFTQLLTCRDLSRCDVLQCKYAPIIAPNGGIVNDPILLRLGENRFWLSLADSDAMLYALGVQAFAGMDVTIREPDVSPLQVQGPKSKDVIRTLFGDEVGGSAVLPVLGG